ncbi:class I SAM-dependent methyltransferase [Rhodohalobacter sulfatireducens]|uniref:Class I SAM-dependent methyltransferase n=1 Tax=Rhodohalobacter sulfatireducens TaxID=2911366 RepID=A0ABS9KIZ8_9BACT|nr:class I SAM-dependent methyltransferase [Rhodohalobacter sulfatireducens]MCG2590825.1 class I SAM-dependent methyltransferase [Rhodohalobacter sulfatireducens]
MNIQEIVSLFSGPNGENKAREYLESNNVLPLILQESQQIEGRISPDLRDLARLHATIRARKIFTILEFGIGYSTIVMAKALKKNQEDWDELEKKPLVRKSTPFEVHCVDASTKWIDVTLNGIPPDCKHIVKTHETKVNSGLFSGRSCHFYNQIPNVIPDFIYLDAPHPNHVRKRDGKNSKWSKNKDRVIMSGDLLRMEPVLLPGACILVDGRTANARFLKHFFYRNWSFIRDENGDVTAMELQEKPLGDINKSTLKYTLGKRITEWVKE